MLQRPIAIILIASLFAAYGYAGAQQHVVIERSGESCELSPTCINRLHPDIPPVAYIESGGTATFETPSLSVLPSDGPRTSTIHELAGPLHVEGAMAGDVLGITVESIVPGDTGVTVTTDNGLLAELFPGPPRSIEWQLTPEAATSDALPGIRIPNESFAGLITGLPGRDQIEAYLRRDRELVAAGGRSILLPEPVNAVPASLCGPDGEERDTCVRTIPPREHGGNMDIAYQGIGTTIYIPCYIDGCGLLIGDVHYAQGDGEVAGTAIEMSADVTVKVEIVTNKSTGHSPHFEGPGTALGRVPARFYATTGLPLKDVGDVPSFAEYLRSPVVGRLEVLPDSLMLAARNALAEMIRYLETEKGLTADQAYLLASVAVDLRIGQVVDGGYVNVVAVLPLDIFVDEQP